MSRGGPETDPAIVNIPLAKRYGKGGIDAELDRWKAEQARVARREQRERQAARRAAREAEKARPKFTAEDVRGARFVRDQYGWHKVVRVSAKSVSVETGYSWVDRIALDRVLEVVRDA